jgi:hypothetical protein
MLVVMSCIPVAFDVGDERSLAGVLPAMFAVWIFGHAGLWIFGRMAERPEPRALSADGEILSWPPVLILVAAGTGLITLLGAFSLLVSFAQWRPDGSFERVWLTLLVTWLAHAVCFASVLLRRRSSALLATVLCYGWAIYLVAAIVAESARGLPIEFGALATTLVQIAISVLLGRHLATSRRIKLFLSIPVPD